MFNAIQTSQNDVSSSPQAQIDEIEAHLSGVADNLKEVGRLWASQGLRVAQSSLKVAETTLRDTARTLGDIRDTIEG